MGALLGHRLAPAVAIAVILLLLPLVFPSTYYYRIAALVFIFALASLGLNLLMGFAGQVICEVLTRPRNCDADL